MVVGASGVAGSGAPIGLHKIGDMGRKTGTKAKDYNWHHNHNIYMVMHGLVNCWTV